MGESVLVIEGTRKEKGSTRATTVCPAMLGGHERAWLDGTRGASTAFFARRGSAPERRRIRREVKGLHVVFSPLTVLYTSAATRNSTQ